MGAVYTSREQLVFSLVDVEAKRIERALSQLVQQYEQDAIGKTVPILTHASDENSIIDMKLLIGIRVKFCLPHSYKLRDKVPRYLGI